MSISFGPNRAAISFRGRGGIGIPPTPITRYFRRNEGTTDYATIPEVTTSASCDIEFDIYTDRSSVFYVFGNSANFNNRVSIGTNGSFNVRTSNNNTAFDAPSNTIPINAWTNFRLVLDSNVIEVFINGSSIGSNATGGIFQIDQLFRNSTSVNGAGILANLKIWDNGTLIRDYPLDDNSDILRNQATVLGGEQYSFSSVGTSEGVTITETVSGFVATSTSPNLDRTYINLTTEIGRSYRLISNRVALSGVPSLTLFVREDPNGVGSIITSTGDINVDLIFTATTTTTSILYDAPNTSGTVSYELASLSIRQADGYGTVINGNASDWGLFQQQATGEWLGQELVVNGGFDTDSDWIVESEWSISGGLATMASTSAFNTIRQHVGFVGGLSYQVSLDIISVTGNMKAMEIANIGTSNLPLFEFNSIGRISENVIIDASGGRPAIGFSREVVTSSCSIDNVSVKEVLNVA